MFILYMTHTSHGKISILSMNLILRLLMENISMLSGCSAYCSHEEISMHDLSAYSSHGKMTNVVYDFSAYSYHGKQPMLSMT